MEHQHPDPQACHGCQHDLAACLTCERNDGMSAALETYPHVWAHLQICPRCAETYRLIGVVLAAERAGIRPSLQEVLGDAP